MVDDITEHPRPAADLGGRPLPVRVADASWVRVHRLEHSPIFFNRDRRGRYNATDGRYGILYVAEQIEGAFVETFCRTENALRLVDSAEARLRGWSSIYFARPLRLCDLTGDGLAQIGADARVLSGSWALAQSWAGAIESHPDKVDGIRYRARHDPSRICAAVFHRAGLAASSKLEGRFASDDEKTWPRFLELCDRYRVGLI